MPSPPSGPSTKGRRFKEFGTSEGEERGRNARGDEAAREPDDAQGPVAMLVTQQAAAHQSRYERRRSDRSGQSWPS